MEGKIRRGLSALLCLMLCLAWCLSAAGAAEGRDLSRQEGLAMRLERLGLFLGVGQNEDGSTDFDLDRPLSREEAVTMLVRALGKGPEAEGMGKTHPFADVPAWADGYVSYAYENGLTKGTSDTAFGVGDTATGAMYMTFMLRALGYVDGEDFTWEDPWPMAEACGILPGTVDREAFLRADAVDVTAAALSAGRKGTDTTLAQQLIAEGAVTQDLYDRAFQTYEEAMAEVFANGSYQEEYRWESDYGTVLLGRIDGAPHDMGSSLQLVTKPAAAIGEGLTIILPLPRQSFFASAAPEQPAMSGDGETFTYSVHFDEPAVIDPGLASEERLHEAGTYAYTVDLRTGKVTETFQPAEPAPSEPVDGQAAYEAAVAGVLQGDGTGPVTLVEQLEGTACTALYIRVDAGPHGEFQSLALVYKPGAAKPAGETLYLHLPQVTGATQAPPEDMAFSGDGKTFTFTCTVDGSSTVQQPGAYHSTVDLATGEVVLDFEAAA